MESMAEPPNEEVMLGSLFGVLKEWGCTWMWDSLCLVGDEDWIKGAIERGSLICVEDGLYIKEMVPNLCSAVFILECNERKGRIIGFFSNPPGLLMPTDANCLNSW